MGTLTCTSPVAVLSTTFAAVFTASMFSTGDSEKMEKELVFEKNICAPEKRGTREKSKKNRKDFISVFIG